MRFLSSALSGAIAIAASGATHAHALPVAPAHVIFDTDMWGDIDDMLALAGLHVLQDRGEARILAITSSTSDPWCAVYIDLLDAFYGHPDIPVGLIRSGVKPPTRWAGDGAAMAEGMPMYTQYVSQLRKPDGPPRFPHRLVDGAHAPDSVALLRKTLAAQPDGSVVMIEIGFSTNLARLLDSRPDQDSPLDGAQLVKRKVRILSMMAGRYADATWQGETVLKSRPEYNIRKDIPAAQAVFRSWPTPIVASGSEVGFTLRLNGDDLAKGWGYAPYSPALITYRYMDSTYQTQPSPGGALHNHKTFDLTAVLYAIRPASDYFSLSPSGTISVRPDGVSVFEAQSAGNVRYLEVSEAQRPRVLDAMTSLLATPPARPTW